MKNKKTTGSYYTPECIAHFLVDYLSDKIKGREGISILEPSAGDGIFIRTIYNNESISGRIKNVVAVEQDKTELNKIIREVSQTSFTACHSDFLEFQRVNKQKFTLVIGNPPYIKKSFLNPDQILECSNIHQSANLADFTPKNIWTSFLVRCIEYTADDGILAFVLPSEFLQVKFARELRELILNKFERIEIFTFNELIFKESNGQDTLLLIAEKQSKHQGVYYCNIDKLADLGEGKFILAQNVKIKESKWTHHHLETFEIELLEKLKQHINTVNDYCTSKAGIVTAANDYFIVNAELIEEYSLQNFAKPIIQKGLFVNGSIDLNQEDFQILVDSSKPAFLIAIDKHTHIRSNSRFWKYKQLGETQNIHKRYKTSQRKNWYEIPNIGTPPEAFFFKRCHEYPKLIKNTAQVLASDSAYIITMRDSFNLDSFIFSFYNSLTLAFAELYGRYYGGGVLELTPNEFKTLPVPYLKIMEEDFKSFAEDFRKKISIKEICKRNDIKILRSIVPGIDSNTVEQISKIREKLFLRRIKSN